MLNTETSVRCCDASIRVMTLSAVMTSGGLDPDSALDANNGCIPGAGKPELSKVCAWWARRYEDGNTTVEGTIGVVDEAPELSGE